MPTRQQEAGAWLSIYGRGLRIALGTGGFIYELGFDHLQHPVIIPSLVLLLGLGPILEPVWRQILGYLLRTTRVSLRIGPWFDLEISQPAPQNGPTPRPRAEPADPEAAEIETDPAADPTTSIVQLHEVRRFRRSPDDDTLASP